MLTFLVGEFFKMPDTGVIFFVIVLVTNSSRPPNRENIEEDVDACCLSIFISLTSGSPVRDPSELLLIERRSNTPGLACSLSAYTRNGERRR